MNSMGGIYVFYKRKNNIEKFIDEHVTKLKLLVNSCGDLNPNDQVPNEQEFISNPNEQELN